MLTEKFGTDALRMGLVIGNTPGTSLALAEDKIKAYKHFANKIWNISRFVLSNTENYDGKKPVSEQDRVIINEFNDLIKDVTIDMDNYRFYLAAEKLYHYVWHTFADKIIEESKDKLKSDDPSVVASIQYTLRYILETSLILIHPFMPFITEEIWQNLNDKENKKLLMITEWPKP